MDEITKRKKLIEKLWIVVGNTGIGAVVLGLIALFVGLRNTNSSTLLYVLFWIFIALGIIALIGCVVALIFCLKLGSKKALRKLIEPEIAGENKKREVFVVAGAIIKDGYVFAAQRGNKGETKFKWEFPGGKIEEGETSQQALIREIKEELDTEIKVDDFVMTERYEYPDFILDMDVFLCHVVKGRLEVEEGIHLAEKWVKITDLDKVDWCPADQEIAYNIAYLYWSH